MAQRIQTLLIDDIDGTDADETLTFALDGVTYEIDLCAGNAEKLRRELSVWAGKSRRTGGRRGTGRRATSPGIAGRRADLAAIREWGRANGYTVSDRGRVAQEIQDAYDQAHTA